MRVRWSGIVMLLGCLPGFARADSILPSRSDIDTWLGKLGANNSFDPAKGIDWGIMPGPFYTPELGLGIGTAVVGMYRPDPTDHVSQNSTLSLSGYFTSTGALGLTFQNYSFFADDQWRFFADGSLANTPTYYWGQGFSAAKHNHNRQKYTSQAFTLRPSVQYRIAPATYIGVGWSVASEHAADIHRKSRGTLENEAQGTSVMSSGASVNITYDTRDFVPNPHQGQLINLRYTSYSSALGSDSRFDEYETRYSLYHPVNDKTVVAWEVDGHFTQGHVPWNMLPELGNGQRMRGYYEGRYRDRDVVSTQVEYRRKLDWRNGIVGWLGTGTMSPSMHQLGQSTWLPSVGVGYRFEFKPGMNVRLDYGVGRSSSGFYFQVGEAF